MIHPIPLPSDGLCPRSCHPPGSRGLGAACSTWQRSRRQVSARPRSGVCLLSILPEHRAPTGGDTGTVRLSVAVRRPREQQPQPGALPSPHPGASALYPGTPGSLLSPLPGRALFMEQRPGTVRAELEAKCIFSLGKQGWCRCAPSSSVPHR